MMVGSRRWRLAATLSGLLLLLCFPGRVQAAKYAGEAFTLGAGARALAVGGAYTALAADPSGIYYNPAGLASVTRDELTLLHSETFGSLLNHDFIAYSHPGKINNRNIGLGAGVYRVGGGGIKLTEWDQELGRPVVAREVSHYDYLLLAGGGFPISERLRVGAATKIIVRSLGDDNGFGLGIDLGLQYDPLEALTVAVAVANATSSFISYDNGTKESIYPVVTLGGTYLRRFGQVGVRLVADGEFLFEGRRESAQFWIDDISLDTRFGSELSYHELVFFRAGSDIGKLTIGVGVKINRFALDGAFLNHGDLDNSYRVSLTIEF